MPALIATNPGNTAVGTVAATVTQVAAGSKGPGTIIIGSIPQVTAVPTLATVTATLLRSDTGAVIGSATITNGAAGTQAVGPLIVIGTLPTNVPPNTSIFLQVVGSSAAGNAVGTATAPCILTLIDADYVPGS